MYAVLQSGGKQFRVAPGDTIHVEKLAGEPGAAIELASVLAVVNDGSLTAGADTANARIKATIVSHGRGDKVIVFKFKRKKQYKKTIGHRQDYTAVRIDEIVA
ncbi:MAG: 50S ribosomal protein L21 [Bryobacterales bacterium]|nr:50S ribosomal protein L21 [Bryobacterales bacterium]